MTRLHRQWHRRVALTLALLLPLGFAIGLLARRPVPVMPVNVSWTGMGTNQLNFR